MLLGNNGNVGNFELLPLRLAGGLVAILVVTFRCLSILRDVSYLKPHNLGDIHPGVVEIVFF